jgi:hypothetical protein
MEAMNRVKKTKKKKKPRKGDVGMYVSEVIIGRLDQRVEWWGLPPTKVGDMHQRFMVLILLLVLATSIVVSMI